MCGMNSENKWITCFEIWFFITFNKYPLNVNVIVNIDIAGFPNVLGAVDGTHVRIQRPRGEEVAPYRNRKGYFSINVQVWKHTLHWKSYKAINFPCKESVCKIFRGGGGVTMWDPNYRGVRGLIAGYTDEILHLILYWKIIIKVIPQLQWEVMFE